MNTPTYLIGVECEECERRGAFDVCPHCASALCDKCLRKHQRLQERQIGGRSIRRGDEDDA